MAGELRGYRRFRLAADGLHSTVHATGAWSSQLEHAICTAGHDHPAPAARCGWHLVLDVSGTKEVRVSGWSVAGGQAPLDRGISQSPSAVISDSMHCGQRVVGSQDAQNDPRAQPAAISPIRCSGAASDTVPQARSVTAVTEASTTR